MARARTLKPGFFANEHLADCSAFARLLFAGLWLIADKEGRLEDRPRKIKAEIFPHDPIDCNALLSELDKNGFITRYEVGEGKFIQVLNFGKHQNPHPKEAASTIPEMTSHVIKRQDPEIPEQAGPSLTSPLPSPDTVLRTAPGGAVEKPLPEEPLDLKRKLWGTGKAFLTKHGCTLKQAGSLLGEWRRDYGDAAVIDALAVADAECVSDPVSFVIQTLRKRHGSNRKVTPAESLYGGFAIAVDRAEQHDQAAADCRENINPVEPLLDSGGRSKAEITPSIRLVG